MSAHAGCGLCKAPATGEVLTSIIDATGKGSVAVCKACLREQVAKRPGCADERRVGK